MEPVYVQLGPGCNEQRNKNELVESGTHYIRTFQTLMPFRSLLFREKNLLVVAGWS